MTPFLQMTPLRRLLWLGGVAANKDVEDTATGNPLSFVTDLAKPLSRLAASFLPVQSGTGDPSPENVRPISGWSGVTVGHSGANLFDGLMEYGNIDNSGSDVPPSNQNYYRAKSYISAKPNQSYTFSGVDTSEYAQIYTLEYDVNKSFIADTRIQQTKGNTVTFTTTASTRYFRFFFYKSGGISEGLATGLMVNIGSTAETYEQYKPVTSYPVTFPETIYGGYVDLISGEVWKTWETVDMGSLRWLATGTSTTGVYRMYTPSLADVIEIPESNSVVGKVICSVYQHRSADSTYSKNMGVSVARNKSVLVYDADYNEETSVDDFKASVTGQMLAYGLATPILVTTLTPSQITALVGNNTVWSDANGDCEVTFLKKG